MGRFTFRRPTAALVGSVIALMISLGGTSYAAFTLPKKQRRYETDQEQGSDGGQDCA
jgi:hypothetical protein